MSDIRILVDVGGGSSSLKEVVSDLQKVLEITDEIKKKKTGIVDAKSTQDVAALTKEIEDLRAKYERLTAEKVKAKTGDSDLQKAVNKLAKAQSDEGKELAKINQQIKETNQLNKIQGGILGDLLKKRKQLQESLVSAKTTDEVKKINQELFKTNGEILKVKEGGVKAFNSWGNALQSFQFKFNALGSTIGTVVGNFASGALSGGISLLTSGLSMLAGAFIETIIPAKKSAEAIQEETDRIKDLIKATGELTEFQKKRMEVLGQSEADIKDIKKAEDELNKGLEEEAEKREEQIRSEKELRDTKVGGLNDLKRELEILKVNGSTKATIAKKEKEIRETELNDLLERQRILGDLGRLDIELQQQILDKRNEINVEQTKFNKDVSDEKRRLLMEDAERVRSAIDKERAYEINALDGKFGEAEQIIAKQSIETKIALGTVLPDELQAYNAQIAKETKDLIDEKKKINDEFVKYEIDALDGSFGEAERIIARQQLATKIALGTATIPEIKAWNELLKKEADVASAAKKKRLEEEFQVAERFANAAFEGMQERNAKELQQNSDKITELDRQIAYQRDLALQGEINTLQEVEKARAEALAEKAAMEKKSANLAKGEKAAEIFLEFYKAYANEKEGAFMKALTATAKGKGGEAIVKALFSGSFYDGTEDTGTGGTLDARGGQATITHPHERIMSRAHNEAIGGISNEEVVRRVNLFNDIPVVDKGMDVQVNEVLNKMLLSEVKGLRKAAENPPYMDMQRNIMNEIITIEKRLGQITETTHKKIGSSFLRD